MVRRTCGAGEVYHLFHQLRNRGLGLFSHIEDALAVERKMFQKLLFLAEPLSLGDRVQELGDVVEVVRHREPLLDAV